MKLSQIIQALVIEAAGGNLEQEVTQITNDSRQACPRSLFVAIPGFKTDGHHYIKDALEHGATAFLIEDPAYQSAEYPWVLVSDTRKAMADVSALLSGYPSSHLNIIGVTGTNGKTTTTNLITQLLEAAGHKSGLIGTIHNRIGTEIIPVHHTTPEAPELQKTLAYFLERQATYAVMEVSSHALELHRVRATEFDVAVFTNLTQDHLDFHSTMEAYLAAKARLFSHLGKASTKARQKFAILNADDPSYPALAALTSVPIITYGINHPADVQAEQVEITAQGVNYLLKYTQRKFPVRLKMTGLFNVYNTLAALAVGLIEGLDPEVMIKTLEAIPGIPGRFERVDEGQNFAVIIDYCHTPDSLKNCLKTARQFTRGRVMTVFGCGGDRDKSKRPIMGEIAGRLSDLCFVTSDNPRSERPQDIIEDILPGLQKADAQARAMIQEDRRTAIYQAIKAACPGDTVIIAGKGHEDYQIIGDQVHHFSDREVATEALKARSMT